MIFTLYPEICGFENPPGICDIKVMVKGIDFRIATDLYKCALLQAFLNSVIFLFGKEALDVD